MQHDITNLRHHKWVSASKINVYSPKEINKGDTILLKDESFNVVDICDIKQPDEENKKYKGTMFYELKVA